MRVSEPHENKGWTYPFAGSESLCQAQLDSVLNGSKVCILAYLGLLQNTGLLTCMPVLSTLYAKFPFPTWRGVVSLSMRLVRTILNCETTCFLWRLVAGRTKQC